MREKVAQHPASLIGQRIGTYTILSLLGAGGMGEVYRAHDEKLQRDVAIKILPPKFTADPDRAARFEREARVLATLNHPSIAAIYGYVEFGGVRGLVLELVEGPTLLDRIASSPLPVPEALAIGIQVAEALEAAHEKGIIHRDLKPANIKVAPDGRVKVLDFGLATTFDVDPIRSDRSDAATMTASPTHAGLILGTVAYMSPEQTRGGPVDKRTDIWAFGCVLYEMLTGRTPFFSATASDVMAGILEREPNWDTLPPKTSPRVRQLLGRCLEKDPRKRLRDIGDARLELTDAIGAPASSHRPTRVRPRRLAWKFVAFATAALILGAAVVWSGIARYFSATTEHRLSDGNRPSPNTEANAYYERALLFGGAGTADPDQAQRMIERALALNSTFAGARAENAFYQVAPILNGRLSPRLLVRLKADTTGLKPPLEVRNSPEHRFDVDDRRAIDRFDGADPKAVAGDPPNSDPVKAQWIWPVGRTRRKHAGQRIALVRARVDLQHVAPRPVQPRHDDDLVAGREAVETFCRGRTYVEPGVRRPLGSLSGCLAARLDAGSDHANQPHLRSPSSLHSRPPRSGLPAIRSKNRLLCVLSRVLHQADDVTTAILGESNQLAPPTS